MDNDEDSGKVIGWCLQKYRDMFFTSSGLISKPMTEAFGFCWTFFRSPLDIHKQPISDLLLLSVPGGINKPGNWTTYVKTLFQDATKEGPVGKKELGTTVENLKTAMCKREAWRKTAMKIN